MYKITIVEDDNEIREELKILLQNSGYEVNVLVNFENVEQQIFKTEAHLILLDVNLPYENGYEICSKIRLKSKVPIIFVTSKNQSMDELNGILRGGDDYIEKPYHVPILLARIQTLLNRVYSDKATESILTYKGITLDLLRSEIKYENQETELTKTELKTLYYLFKHTDQIIARMDLIDYLWDHEIYARKKK